MVKEIEGEFNVGDSSLYQKFWLPDESTPTIAKFVFIHGFSDHLGRYYGFFPTLAAAGIAVYGYDQRGWGKSVRKPAERGLTGPTTQVLADVAKFITDVALPAEPRTVPLFVMGHSMGGGEVLTLACTPEYEDNVVAHVRGWMLEAPLVALDDKEKPSALKVFAGRLAGRVLPHMHLANPIPPEQLSRDEAVQQSLKEDTLCHDTGTLEGLAGLLDRSGELSSGKLKLSSKVKSLWFGHGDKDVATSYPESKKFFERQTQIEDKTFKTYEGWLHQLHAEVGREEFYTDVRDWILQRCDGKEQGTTAATNNKTTKESESEDSKVDSKL
ncbi:hypothetical protein N0V93_006241 [Gnomoniopsis smithogilvyi]|uniref:Serine aminopeptidase S33 domain-containing protein n=1 Tax=Gnomoniopsis smithogilvyi TaxID=1191159 RepID=A0A9W8YQE1_9PEZI|nr:hypothetical protein N0V93_006241 [Gnomoniopsis smithogilvyi]